MKYYHCPNCGVSIPDRGDKILKHKTFCKSSYENFSTGSMFTEPTSESLSDLLAVDLNKIPKGMKIEKNRKGETSITFKSNTRLPWLLLAVSLVYIFFFFLSGSPYSMMFNRRMIPWLVVFGLALLFLFLNLISNWIGKWSLVLKNGKGEFFYGTGKYRLTQRFEYNQDSTVSIIMPGRLPYRFSQTALSGLFMYNFPFRMLAPSLGDGVGIVVNTNGRNFIFGGMLPQVDVVKYLAVYILREISK
jgi:hypothetical protein